MNNSVIFGISVAVVASATLFFIFNKKKNMVKVKKYDCLKFSEVVKLTKEYEDKNENESIVLLKKENNYILTLFDNQTNEINQENIILLECNSIDENLSVLFGEKGMILIEA